MHRPESRRRRGPLPAAVLSVTCLVLLCSAAADPTEEQQSFLAAEAALKTGDTDAFTALADSLLDYPLYPYLRYRALAARLDRAKTAEVEQFLDAYEDTPLAPRLRRAWLKRLAKLGRWQDYVRLYEPDGSTERRCHYLHGLIRTDRQDEAFPEIQPQWMVGETQPEACEPVFAAWESAGCLTDELIWARIGLAMEVGRRGLARRLGKSLPAADKVWLDRWLAVHKDAAGLLTSGVLDGPHAQQAPILVHGVRRLARRSPHQAAQVWEQLQQEMELPQELAEHAAAGIGLALAAKGSRAGLAYLDLVRTDEANMDLQERRLRLALELGDWQRVAAWIEAMPDGQRKSEHWLYWQARAEEMLGDGQRAGDLFAEAAEERSLWGFLAAERSAYPYKLDNLPTPAARERIERIEQGPAGRRIRELGQLGREPDMRREWAYLTRDMGPEDLKAAAVVARRRGWPDQAIFTLARSGFWDDLGLRFPLLHCPTVLSQAHTTGIDAAWIFAVLRQESTFNEEAVSPAGALGLMQLMPATARAVARSLRQPRPSRSDLFDPQRNIRLGSSYLAEMSRRFGGHEVLATAAYNAGPHRVEKWLPAERVDADVWVATIPFRETRSYVRRVLAYRLIYQDRLGEPITPLSSIMRSINRESDKGESGTRADTASAWAMGPARDGFKRHSKAP